MRTITLLIMLVVAMGARPALTEEKSPISPEMVHRDDAQTWSAQELESMGKRLDELSSLVRSGGPEAVAQWVGEFNDALNASKLPVGKQTLLIKSALQIASWMSDRSTLRVTKNPFGGMPTAILRSFQTRRFRQ